MDLAGFLGKYGRRELHNCLSESARGSFLSKKRQTPI